MEPEKRFLMFKEHRKWPLGGSSVSALTYTKGTKWWIDVITLPCDPHLKFTKEHFRFSLSFFFLFAEIKKQPKENLFINVKNLTSSNEPRFSGISQRIRYDFFSRKKNRFSYINNRSDSPDVWRYSFSWAVFSSFGEFSEGIFFRMLDGKECLAIDRRHRFTFLHKWHLQITLHEQVRSAFVSFGFVWIVRRFVLNFA